MDGSITCEDEMQRQNQSQGRQQGDNDDTKGLQQEGETRGGVDAGDPNQQGDKSERIRQRQQEVQRRQRRDGGSPV